MKPAILRVVSAMALVVLLAGHALAADKDQARQLLQSGLTSMKAGDWLAAAADLERSSALHATPDSLLNLAACYKSLQRYAEALDLLKRLRQEFDGKLKPNIVESAFHLEAELQAQVATLVLSVEPPSAEVSIDGRVSLASSATESYLLAPGDHTVQASLAGYRTLTRSVHLAPGAQTTERLALELEPGTLMVESSPTGATVTVDGQERARTPTEALELTPGKHSVVLTQEGRLPAEKSIEIRSGEHQVWAAVLLPVAPPLPVLAPGPAAGANPGLVTASVEPVKPKTGWLKTLGQFSGVGAVLVGGSALVLWQGVAESHFRKMKEYDRQYMSTGDPSADRNRRTALKNAQTAGYAAIGCGIGAGLLAATALTAFILDARKDGDNGTPSLSLSATGIRLGF
jgi:hypothetical protein